ncbi:MAG: hypothetical protein ACI915_001612 [Gammaproteobacteria bacterium]|jgi:hypothetical protein
MELAPHGIHVAHFVLDGGIISRVATPDGDKQFDPDVIAQSYLDIHRRHHSAWTWEVELRLWVEKFKYEEKEISHSSVAEEQMPRQPAA